PAPRRNAERRVVRRRATRQEALHAEGVRARGAVTAADEQPAGGVDGGGTAGRVRATEGSLDDTGGAEGRVGYAGRAQAHDERVGGRRRQGARDDDSP